MTQRACCTCVANLKELRKAEFRDVRRSEEGHPSCSLIGSHTRGDRDHDEEKPETRDDGGDKTQDEGRGTNGEGWTSR